MVTFDNPIQDLIRRRKSIRTYSSEPVPQAAIDTLDRAAAGLGSSPFGETAGMGILDRGDPGGERIRLGTYGFVKGARHYLYGTIRRSPTAHVSYGYLLELLILKATDLGLGTCWIGFYEPRSFLAEIKPEAGCLVPAVSPLGYPATRQSLYEGLAKRAINSANRKPPGSLFFDGSFERPFPDRRSRWPAGPCGEALELLRLSPSAANRQPWRVLQDAGHRGTGDWTFHFYLDRSHGLKGFHRRGLPGVDIGIGMCHFHLGVTAAGIPGDWHVEPRGAIAASSSLDYVATWRG